MKAPRPANAAIDLRRFNGWLNDFAAYRHSVSQGSIEAWLAQFDPHDRDLGARVLDVVEFIGQPQIAAAFRNNLQSIPGWNAVESGRKGKLRFAAYSSSSGESGDTMLHQFRLANGLDSKRFKHLFIHRSELLLQDLGSEDTLLLVDDFVGTGKQVCDAWKDTFAELVAGIGRVYLIVVAATPRSSERIQTDTDLTLAPSRWLDESDDLFCERCRHFSDAEKSRLLKYNKKADRNNPKGFGECGLVVVFQHRCPNDSIPILHVNNEKWTGLFRRHDL